MPSDRAQPDNESPATSTARSALADQLLSMPGSAELGEIASTALAELLQHYDLRCATLLLCTRDGLQELARVRGTDRSPTLDLSRERCLPAIEHALGQSGRRRSLTICSDETPELFVPTQPAINPVALDALSANNMPGPEPDALPPEIFADAAADTGADADLITMVCLIPGDGGSFDASVEMAAKSQGAIGVLMAQVGPVRFASHWQSNFNNDLQALGARLTLRQAAQDAQERANHYHRIVEQASEGLFELDVDGRLLWANTALATILGYGSIATLTAEADRIELWCDDRTQGEALLAAGILAGTGQPQTGAAASSIVMREVEAVRRDGSTIWLELRLHRLSGNRGPYRLGGSAIDISERHARQVEAQRRHRAEAAAAARREFLAHMSHEIRTPLNGVLGFTQLGLMTDDPEQLHDYLNTIGSAGRQLLAIVNDVLDLARIEEGKLSLASKVFNPAGLLSESCRLFAPLAHAKQLEIAWDFASDSRDVLEQAGSEDDATVHLRGDPQRLTQVLNNLLSNAIKFTHRGSVRAHCQVSHTTSGLASLQFTVTDTGIGISQDQQERLFEPFEQVDPGPTRNYDGSGLGLSIARRLVHAMGGVLQLESEAGAGATFVLQVQLPVASVDEILSSQAQEHSLPQLDANVGAPPTPGLAILLVEDNPLNQRLSLELLEHAGATVTLANDGHEAVEQAAKRTFDLILMDMHMPRLNGIAAGARIRKLAHHERTPMIALSADLDSDRQRQARDVGFDEFMGKPLDVAQLFGLLQRIGPDIPATPARRRSDAGVPQPPGAGGTVRLTGINVSQALRHHRNDAELLERTMTMFLEYYADASELLQGHLRAEETAAAQTLAHNLRGVAGSIGAQNFQRACAELERALESGTAPSAAQVHAFVRCHQEVCTSARTLQSRAITLRADDYPSASA